MLIELAHFLAFIGLGLAMAQGVLGLVTDNRSAAGKAATGAFITVLLSFLLLVVAFVRSDFSVQLVATNSHTLKPLFYKIAGTWGNHEGSMLMWCLVTVGFGAAGAKWLRSDRPVFEARAIGIQGLIAVGSMAYLLFASSPFTRLVDAPLQGAGLNPLLQDPALAIHPPLLYLGYVGFSFVFALAGAGLIEGRIDRDWAKITRGWVLAAFVPLTIGILLGSYWAYYELGWGGWWFWDPVENASLMPWLIGAALIHSIIVTEKRGSFGAWTALLAVLAFCLSILGAFLVRSGLLTSVHAFAVDPLRGSLLLTGLLIYGGAALALFAIRAPALKGGAPWKLVSREGALMTNNLVLGAAAATVLLGTLFPLIAEAAGRQMSVGEPYFNATFTPLMALLLLILPVVQAWSWGKADVKQMWRWPLVYLALIVVVLAIVRVFGWLGVDVWDISLGAAFGLGLGVWLVGGSIYELKRRAMVWPRIFKLPARVWGMSLAHMGLGLFVMGAVIETTQRYEATLALPMGGTGTVAGWDFRLDDVRSVEGPNWYADRAVISAVRGGQTATLTPSKRYYPAARMPTTETAIHKTGTGDLYAAIGDRREVDGTVQWTFRVYYNPMVDFVFFGVLIMGLGGLLAMFGKPARRREAVPAPDAEPEAAS